MSKIDIRAKARHKTTFGELLRGDAFWDMDGDLCIHCGNTEQAVVIKTGQLWSPRASDTVYPAEVAIINK